MKTVKCNSCNATYGTTQADGTAYFHVCHAQVTDQFAICDASTGTIITPANHKAASNPRNENIKPHASRDDKILIVSEGAGVTEMT